VERCRTEAEPGFALLFLEMDRFKLINDALGHRAATKCSLSSANGCGMPKRPARSGRFGDHQFVYVVRDVEAKARREPQVIGCDRCSRPPYTISRS